MSEMGNLLDNVKNLEKYMLIAVLHHHLLPIPKPNYYDEKWFEKILPSNFMDMSLKLLDADLFFEWLRRRNVRIVLHGHKHIPFLAESDGITVIGCGRWGSFIAWYLETGLPLMTKRLTVDGDIVRNPGNVEVIIGTPIRELLDFCGGLTEEPGKVLYGGPMMGICVADLDQPVLKNNNAILAMSRKAAQPFKETNCIHCGRCTNACPLGLSAKEMVQAYERGDTELLARLNTDLCMSCGTCSFVCPAKRPLSQKLALAKIMLKNGGKKS